MPNRWQESYTVLKDYIAKNPGIEISPNVVVIPGDVRLTFYQFFDALSSNFIQDNFSEFLSEGYILSKNYDEISQNVIQSLGLETIDVRNDVMWFLRDPLDGLMRVLFDSLFSLLKGKVDLPTFEEISKREVEVAFKNYFEYGYRRWVELSLTSLLIPSKNYRLPIKEEFTDPDLMDISLGRGVCERTVPDVEETKSICFEQQGQRLSFVGPQILVYSSRLGCHAAVKSDFYWPYFKARPTNNNAEWLEMPPIQHEFHYMKLWPDITIYTAPELTDLALVSDYSRTIRPDIAIEVMEDSKWYEDGQVESVRLHHLFLKPRMGTYVICREKVPDTAVEKLITELTKPSQPLTENEDEIDQAQDNVFPMKNVAVNEDIQLIYAGYNIATLGPILEKLERSVVKGKVP